MGFLLAVLELTLSTGLATISTSEQRKLPALVSVLRWARSPESTAAVWANEADYSAYEENVNPVADCFSDAVVQVTFDDCRRKPRCVSDQNLPQKPDAQ